MKNDKWVKRWKVPSTTNPDQIHIVALDKDGNYGCSCPVWKFHRKECHHIIQVKSNPDANTEIVVVPQRPKYVLARVLKPEYDKETHSLLIPLIGIPDAQMMEATICYYLLKYGYSLSEIRDMRRIPPSWTKEAIINHVKTNGEAQYPETWYQH